ncbi:thymidylate synthase, partial [Fusobacterium nucleatum]|uniref:thymidylate synthase n=1 Tax=Fusobacterium nucleatum TaxID=851 RepID=UPI0018F153C4
ASTLGLTTDEFDIVNEFVLNKTKDICEEIYSGNIDIRPFRYKNKKPCDYCKYKSICRFDIKHNKYNNIKNLLSHVWDEWADENGSIGKAYGYQLGVKHKYKEGMFDQVDRVIYDLKNNPYSRRIITNIYVHEDLSEMNLYPCAYSMTFNVTGKK